LTALPAGLVWKLALRSSAKLCPPPDGAIWPVAVRISASEPTAPALAPGESNFGWTRSRGLKFGVSELETFSESRRCRSWCHCILVRNTDNMGRSLMDIAAALHPSRHDALR